MPRKLVLALAAICVAAGMPAAAVDSINPQADFKAFRDYFTRSLPPCPAQ